MSTGRCRLRGGRCSACCGEQLSHVQEPGPWRRSGAAGGAGRSPFLTSAGLQGASVSDPGPKACLSRIRLGLFPRQGAFCTEGPGSGVALLALTLTPDPASSSQVSPGLTVTFSVQMEQRGRFRVHTVVLPVLSPRVTLITALRPDVVPLPRRPWSLSPLRWRCPSTSTGTSLGRRAAGSAR